MRVARAAPACLQAGTDVEPLSIKAAAANAEHNSVAGRLALFRCEPSADAAEPLAAAGEPEEARQFDVVVANILQVRGGRACIAWISWPRLERLVCYCWAGWAC